MARQLRWIAASTVWVLLLAACTGGPGATAPAQSPATSPATSPASSPAPGNGGSEYPRGNLGIMAPADPGGGWDSTARAMQRALEAEVVDTSVEVYNVGGAGGTIGLAEFVDTHSGDDHQLMVMGLVMVGAIRTNDSAVTLDDVTPIASLTAEQQAIVVPANSEYQTLEELVAAWQADPTSVAWGGGSAGGTDHILVGLLAQAAGVEPEGVNYVAHAGGGEAMAAILSGAVTAGVSSVSEFVDQVAAGELRWLGVSGEQPPAGVDAPTIVDSGFDVVLENWRGVVAAPGIDQAGRDAIVGMITDMRDSEAWQAELEANGWTDFFMAGDEFAGFLEEERERIEGVLQEIGLID